MWALGATKGALQSLAAGRDDTALCSRTRRYGSMQPDATIRLRTRQHGLCSFVTGEYADGAGNG